MRRSFLWARVAWWAMLLGLVELLIAFGAARRAHVLGAAVLLLGMVGSAALLLPLTHTDPRPTPPSPGLFRPVPVPGAGIACAIPLASGTLHAEPIPLATGELRATLIGDDVPVARHPQRAASVTLLPTLTMCPQVAPASKPQPL